MIGSSPDRHLRRENLRWYVFGAQAVAIYGVPRTTADIDLDHASIESTLEELESMLDQRDLRPLYAGLRSELPAQVQDVAP